MSGILAASGGPSSKVYSVGVAVFQGSLYGYIPAVMGTLSSTSLKARTITELTSDVLAQVYDFEFEVDSTVTQNYFQHLTVQDSSGTIRTYRTSAAANFSGTKWSWGNGSSLVWTAEATRQLIVYW